MASSYSSSPPPLFTRRHTLVRNDRTRNDKYKFNTISLILQRQRCSSFSTPDGTSTPTITTTCQSITAHPRPPVPMEPASAQSLLCGHYQLLRDLILQHLQLQGLLLPSSRRLLIMRTTTAAATSYRAHVTSVPTATRDHQRPISHRLQRTARISPPVGQ